MGATVMLFVFGTTEWMTVFDTVATCFTGVLVARVYQSALSKSRKLKDILISETEDIRKEYQDWLGRLYAGSVDITSVKAWLKLMNIRIDHLMKQISENFDLKANPLQPYQILLRELVVDSAEFEAQFRAGNAFTPSDEFRRKLIMFQQDHGHLFTTLIIKINSA